MPEAITKANGSAKVTVVGVDCPVNGASGVAGNLLQILRQSGGSDSGTARFVLTEQLGFEHMLELRDADMVLFIAAAAKLPKPWVLRAVPTGQNTANTDLNADLAPQDMLRVLQALCRSATAPAAYTLSICAQSGDKTALSAASRPPLDSAVDLVEQLLANPDRAAWDNLASGSES